jgi:hypothetical protein
MRTGFDMPGKIHRRYVKGMGEPWSAASMAADKKVRETFPGKPLTGRNTPHSGKKLQGPATAGETL